MRYDFDPNDHSSRVPSEVDIALQMRRILSTCQNLGLIRCLAHFESGEISVELLREDEQDENPF